MVWKILGQVVRFVLVLDLAFDLALEQEVEVAFVEVEV